jgi:hypothetical protein
VAIAGPGRGTVTSAPSGIACATDSGVCAAPFAYGTVVRLTPVAAAGFVFSGWSGCGGGTGATSFSITTDTGCTATFRRQDQALTLTLSGSGRGAVSSSPAGLSCNGPSGTVCAAGFAPETTVTLTAKADPGSAIAGWSGRCARTGADTAVALLDEAAQCTVEFRRVAITPQTGWWWNPERPGRGYSLEVSRLSGGTRAFIGTYLYDADGDPVWYVSQLTTRDEGRTFEGPLLHFRDGPTLSGGYKLPTGAIVGDAHQGLRIEFISESEGRLHLPASVAGGEDAVVPIRRFAFVHGGLETPLAESSPPQTGWWWNPAESGRGMFFEVQAGTHEGATLFSAIYGYEESGEPSWIIGSAALLRGTEGWVASAMPLLRCAEAGIGPVHCVPLAGDGATIQFEPSGVTALLTLPQGRQVRIHRYAF